MNAFLNDLYKSELSKLFGTPVIPPTGERVTFPLHSPSITGIDRDARIRYLEAEVASLNRCLEMERSINRDQSIKLENLAMVLEPFAKALPVLDYVENTERFSLVNDVNGDVFYGNFLNLVDAYEMLTKASSSEPAAYGLRGLEASWFVLDDC